MSLGGGVTQREVDVRPGEVYSVKNNYSALSIPVDIADSDVTPHEAGRAVVR